MKILVLFSIDVAPGAHARDVGPALDRAIDDFKAKLRPMMRGMLVCKRGLLEPTTHELAWEVVRCLTRR